MDNNKLFLYLQTATIVILIIFMVFVVSYNRKHLDLENRNTVIIERRLEDIKEKNKELSELIKEIDSRIEARGREIESLVEEREGLNDEVNNFTPNDIDEFFTDRGY